MFNEMYDNGGGIRAPYRPVSGWIDRTGIDLLKQRNADAEALFRRIGITFAVYGEGATQSG